MKKLTPLLALLALSFYLPSTAADSFALSEDGSAAISTGIFEASGGALKLVTGVLSVPVTISTHTADFSQQQAVDGRSQNEAPLPIADELIEFVDRKHD